MEDNKYTLLDIKGAWWPNPLNNILLFLTFMYQNVAQSICS